MKLSNCCKLNEAIDILIRLKIMFQIHVHEVCHLLGTYLEMLITEGSLHP